MVYHPIAPGLLQIERDEWKKLLAAKPVGAFWPFSAPDNATNTIDAGGRPGRDFADLRAQPGASVYTPPSPISARKSLPAGA